jgi:hypothetical protein
MESGTGSGLIETNEDMMGTRGRDMNTGDAMPEDTYPAGDPLADPLDEYAAALRAECKIDGEDEYSDDDSAEGDGDPLPYDYDDGPLADEFGPNCPADGDEDEYSSSDDEDAAALDFGSESSSDDGEDGGVGEESDLGGGGGYGDEESEFATLAGMDALDTEDKIDTGNAVDDCDDFDDLDTAAPVPAPAPALPAGRRAPRARNADGTFAARARHADGTFATSNPFGSPGTCELDKPVLLRRPPPDFGVYSAVTSSPGGWGVLVRQMMARRATPHPAVHGPSPGMRKDIDAFARVFTALARTAKGREIIKRAETAAAESARDSPQLLNMPAPGFGPGATMNDVSVAMLAALMAQREGCPMPNQAAIGGAPAAAAAAPQLVLTPRLLTGMANAYTRYAAERGGLPAGLSVLPTAGGGARITVLDTAETLPVGSLMEVREKIYDVRTGAYNIPTGTLAEALVIGDAIMRGAAADVACGARAAPLFSGAGIPADVATRRLVDELRTSGALAELHTALAEHAAALHTGAYGDDPVPREKRSTVNRVARGAGSAAGSIYGAAASATGTRGAYNKVREFWARRYKGEPNDPLNEYLYGASGASKAARKAQRGAMPTTHSIEGAAPAVPTTLDGALLAVREQFGADTEQVVRATLARGMGVGATMLRVVSRPTVNEMLTGCDIPEWGTQPFMRVGASLVDAHGATVRLPLVVGVRLRCAHEIMEDARGMNPQPSHFTTAAALTDGGAVLAMHTAEVPARTDLDTGEALANGEVLEVHMHGGTGALRTGTLFVAEHGGAISGSLVWNK